MKEIDRLIEDVFEGSNSPMSRNLDEKSLKEVEFLQTLKSDLKRLKEVPECQLSVDHLRRAMLNQRVPSARKPWFQTWTWVPVAAAAAVAIVMVSRPPQLPSDEIARSTAESTLPPVVDTSDSSSDHVATSRVETVKETDSRETLVARERPPTSVKRRSFRRAESDPMTVAVVTKAMTEVAMDAVGESLSMVSTGTGREVTAPLAKFDAESTSTHVVVVGDTPNPETGAAEAQEVSRPSDVVFGG